MHYKTCFVDEDLINNLSYQKESTYFPHHFYVLLKDSAASFITAGTLFEFLSVRMLYVTVS